MWGALAERGSLSCPPLPVKIESQVFRFCIFAPGKITAHRCNSTTRRPLMRIMELLLMVRGWTCRPLTPAAAAPRRRLGVAQASLPASRPATHGAGMVRRHCPRDGPEQLVGTRRVTQLAQRLGLDLADAFAGDVELLADSSSVWSVFISMPKRMRSTLASRGSGRRACSALLRRRPSMVAASIGGDRSPAGPR